MYTRIQFILEDQPYCCVVRWLSANSVSWAISSEGDHHPVISAIVLLCDLSLKAYDQLKKCISDNYSIKVTGFRGNGVQLYVLLRVNKSAVRGLSP